MRPQVVRKAEQGSSLSIGHLLPVGDSCFQDVPEPLLSDLFHHFSGLRLSNWAVIPRHAPAVEIER